MLDSLLTLPSEVHGVAPGRIADPAEGIGDSTADQRDSRNRLTRLLESGLDRSTGGLHATPESGHIIHCIVYREPQPRKAEDQEYRQYIEEHGGNPSTHHLWVDPHPAKYHREFGRIHGVP